jgi:hypothetical protein
MTAHPAVCVIADGDGQSRLVDLAIPVTRKVTHTDGTAEWVGIAGAGSWGIASAASGGDHVGWHKSTMAGLSVVLQGAWEIEATNGDRRTLAEGAMLIMLDTHGRGHRSHTLREPCASIGMSFDAPAEEAMRTLAQAALAEHLHTQGGHASHG